MNDQAKLHNLEHSLTSIEEHISHTRHVLSLYQGRAAYTRLLIRNLRTKIGRSCLTHHSSYNTVVEALHRDYWLHYHSLKRWSDRLQHYVPTMRHKNPELHESKLREVVNLGFDIHHFFETLDCIPPNPH